MSFGMAEEKKLSEETKKFLFVLKKKIRDISMIIYGKLWVDTS